MESPWPLFMSMSLFINMSLIVKSISVYESVVGEFFLSLVFSLMVFFGWMRDVASESVMLGDHSQSVQDGLKKGMILFIVSEVFFFISLFWSVFFLSGSDNNSFVGWPPMGLSSVDPMGIPLLGTLLLSSSSISITWAHHSVIKGDLKKESLVGFWMTITLGSLFTGLQVMEYMECSFSINDSVFGSLFFMTTGFHGLHVIIGSIFLVVCFLRMIVNHFSSSSHVGVEAAIWYWHFVDTVWLFLYIFVYWWGK